MSTTSTDSSAALPRTGGSVTPGKPMPAPGDSPASTTPATPMHLPRAKAGERYELRDPFEEVTYHGNSIRDMMARAKHLGATRFTAVDAQGKRSVVQQQADGWYRQPLSRPDAARAAPTLASTQSSLDLEPPRAADPQHTPMAKVVDDNPAHAHASRLAQIKASLQERYLIQRSPLRVDHFSAGLTEYRFRGDNTRVAFIESSTRLSTETNSPSVARAMVDVAETRGWQALRVSGSDDFRRMVWMEATLRGLKSRGYEPLPGDMERLNKEKSARQRNRVDHLHDPADVAQGNGRQGTGGRQTVLAAIDAILIAQRVPETRRQAIMREAEQQLLQRQHLGQSFRVQVYDRAPPTSTRERSALDQELQRHRPMEAPSR